MYNICKGKANGVGFVQLAKNSFSCRSSCEKEDVLLGPYEERDCSS